jgi:hypothetical protein
MDSLHMIFNMRSSLDVRVETRRGLIDNHGSSVQGVRLGVAFKRKLRLGGGISWLDSEFLHENYVRLGEDGYEKYYTLTKFAYLCFYVDFVFHRTKRWQLSVPIQTGGGLLWYQTKSKYDLSTGTKYGIFFYEPGITIQFKLTKWAGLGADICYRYALKDRRVTERLSSPTISLKAMLWFDQLFYTVFPEHRMSKEKGPASW